MDITELGTTPIPGADPAGQDPSYDPDFEALQGEIDKLGMVAAGSQGIDWDKTAQLAAKILAEKSKHLLVAVYLGAALVETKKLPGLADAAKLLRDITAGFWETMFPPLKRARARVNAISWWRDRVLAFFESFEGSDSFEAGLIETLSNSISGLDAFLGEKLPDAPSLREISSYVSRLSVAQPEPEEKPADQTETPEAAPGAPAPQPSAPGPQPARASGPAATGDASADAKALFTFGLDQFAKAAGMILEKDLSDPLAYRLSRLAAWMPVAMVPPAEDGKTMIPPPEDELKNALAALSANRQYEELVKACEGRTSQMLFWLDLHRMCAEALDMLGARFRDAQDAVGLETALFVKRLSGVSSLSFADGTPFADAKTRSWLASIALDSGGGAQPAGDVSEKTSKLLEQAMGLVKDKKAVAAVTLLQEALRAAGSGKERFALLTGMAEVLSQAGRADLARPNVEEAMRLIDEYKLESWEPDTALAGLSACHAALRGDASAEAKALADKVLMRVARLSPAAAMRLQV